MIFLCFVLCSGPQPFWHQGPVSWKTIFPRTRGKGEGLRMIQVHYIYCALYLYYYYVSSTSDHQALDPGGWGPLLLVYPKCLEQCLAFVSAY